MGLATCTQKILGKTCPGEIFREGNWPNQKEDMGRQSKKSNIMSGTSQYGMVCKHRLHMILVIKYSTKEQCTMLPVKNTKK